MFIISYKTKQIKINLIIENFTILLNFYKEKYSKSYYIINDYYYFIERLQRINLDKISYNYLSELINLNYNINKLLIELYQNNYIQLIEDIKNNNI